MLCITTDKMSYEIKESSIIGYCQVPIATNQTIALTKYMVFTDSIRYEDYQKKGKTILELVIHKQKSHWYQVQEAYLERFWKYSKIDIEGENQIEYAINYSVYQLLASAGKEPHSNISAKGLSGEGYEGHYFWDTEIYMIPFFTLTNPKIAKNLMRFRYELLEEARVEARALGIEKGLKYLGVPFQAVNVLLFFRRQWHSFISMQMWRTHIFSII